MPCEAETLRGVYPERSESSYLLVVSPVDGGDGWPVGAGAVAAGGVVCAGCSAGTVATPWLSPLVPVWADGACSGAAGAGTLTGGLSKRLFEVCFAAP